MVKVVYIPCLFEDKRYEFSSRNLNITSVLHSLLKRYPEIRQDSSGIAIRVNGKKIHPIRWLGFPLKSGDRVLIYQDPGFEYILTAIFGAGSIIGIGVGGGVVYGLTAAAWATVITAAVTVASVIWAFVSSSAANAKPAGYGTPTYGTQGAGLANSPTYGWDGIQMQIRTGIPVPAVYGEHLIGGNLIGAYVSTDGDKNYLNMLIAVSEGEIEGIMKEDLSGVCSSPSEAPYILINDNFLGNLEGTTWDYRTGTQDQDPIPGFNDIRLVYGTAGVKITASAYIYTTVDADIEALELRFRVPALWNYWNGNFDGRVIMYHVWHRVHGTESWIDDGSSGMAGATRNPIRRYWRKDSLAADRYDFKVTLETPEPDKINSDGDLYLDNVVEIKYDALAYPLTALVAVKILATERLSGQIPNVMTQIRGIKVKNLDTSATAWTRNPIYNVNNFLVSERYGLGRWIQQGQINNDQLISMADYSDEMVGDGVKRSIDAITATSLTDNDYAFVAGDVGKTICCKSPADGTIYSKMVITSVSGGGHTANGTGGWSDGTPALSAGWEFGEKRFELDLAIDSQAPALDLVSQICASFRAMPIWIKDAIQILIDKKEAPCYPFNMGNILTGSFKHNFVSEKNKANSILVNFADRDRRFERGPAEIPDFAAITGGAPKRTKELNLFGASRRSQAYREGRFHLLAAKYQDEQIEARGAIDAIHLLTGEVVDFQHDSPQWGFGGRIMAATINSITLDQEVQIEAGYTYVITIKQPGTGGTEVLETRTVTNGAGFYTTVSVTPNFSAIPPTWGLYLFGKQNLGANPFRLMRTGVTPQLEMGFVASKYSDAVFVDTDLILPESQYSNLPNPAICPQVTDVSLAEGGIILGDGTWTPYIEVGFKKAEVSDLLGWSHAEIYLQLVGVEGWYEYYGKTDVDHGFKIENHAFLKIGNTIRVKVVAVTKNGIKANFADAPTADWVITGKTTGPSDITNFSASQYGDKVIATWSPVSDLDISHYEIREGAAWGTSQIVGENIFGTTFAWFTFSTGLKNLLIKAIDRHGNYSENPAQVQIEINISPSGRPLATLDGLDNPTLNNTLKQWGVYGYEHAIGLKPSQGWDDGGYWDDGSKWDIPISPLTGDFTTEPIDFGKIGKVSILLNDEYIQDGDGQTVLIQIATSTDGSSYTGWITFVTGEYYCRYAKFKITLASDDANENIFVRLLVETGMEGGVTTLRFQNQTIAAGGTTINFGVTFLSNPNIQITPIGTDARIPTYDNAGLSSCKVHLLNTGGTDVGGNADVTVEGQ